MSTEAPALVEARCGAHTDYNGLRRRLLAPASLREESDPRGGRAPEDEGGGLRDRLEAAALWRRRGGKR